MSKRQKNISVKLNGSFGSLPEEKGLTKSISAEVDGIGLRVGLCLFSVLESTGTLVYHFEFRTKATEKKLNWAGEWVNEPLPNPISETGYRSEFIMIPIGGEKQVDVDGQLAEYLSGRAEERGDQWAKDRVAVEQTSLF